MKICFTASSGGHLDELMMLSALMNKYDSFLITEKTSYNGNNANGKFSTYFVAQLNRREPIFPIKFAIEFFYCLKIFIKEKPDVVISLGALATVPVCLVARLLRKKVVFVESFAKITSPTLTGRILYKHVDLFIIQWEGLKKFYPNAVYGGGIF